MVLKISIIIPVYNQEKYLEECLNSVLRQTFKNIEILCINDGSTDESQSILKAYASRDKRIRMINQKNRGLACARNVGLKEAKGEYVAFLDADDLISDNFLESLYQVSIQNHVEIVATSRVLLHPSATYKNMGLINDCIVSDSDKSKIILASGACWNKLYHREFLLNNRITFPNFRAYGEDNYFTFQSILQARKICVVDDCIYYYRQHNQSIVSKKRDKSILSLIKVYQKTYNFVKNNIKEYEKRVFWLDVLEKRIIRNCRQELYVIDKIGLRKKFLTEFRKRFPFFNLDVIETVVSIKVLKLELYQLKGILNTFFSQSPTLLGIILYLRKADFYETEKNIPNDLLEYRKKGLIIKWQA